MSNLIQIKRSSNTAQPGSLANGELAWSSNGDVLYIGDFGSVVAVGGARNPGTLTANQALVANSTSGIDSLITDSFTLSTYNITGIIDDNSFETGVSNTTLATSESIKAYVDSVAGAGVSVLNDITDINAATPTEGNILTWDATESKWVDADLVGGDGITISYANTNDTHTVSVVANNGIIANTTGVFVDGANGISVTADGVNVLAGNNQIVSNTTGIWIDSITAAQISDDIALGTDTSGNYVATIAGTTNEIEVSGSGSETAAVTIGLPNNVTISENLTVSSNVNASYVIANTEIILHNDATGNIVIGSATTNSVTAPAIYSEDSAGLFILAEPGNAGIILDQTLAYMSSNTEDQTKGILVFEPNSYLGPDSPGGIGINGDFVQISGAFLTAIEGDSLYLGSPNTSFVSIDSSNVFSMESGNNLFISAARDVNISAEIDVDISANIDVNIISSNGNINLTSDTQFIVIESTSSNVDIIAGNEVNIDATDDVNINAEDNNVSINAGNTVFIYGEERVSIDSDLQVDISSSNTIDIDASGELILNSDTGIVLNANDYIEIFANTIDVTVANEVYFDVNEFTVDSSGEIALNSNLRTELKGGGGIGTSMELVLTDDEVSIRNSNAVDDIINVNYTGGEIAFSSVLINANVFTADTNGSKIELEANGTIGLYSGDEDENYVRIGLLDTEIEINSTSNTQLIVNDTEVILSNTQFTVTSNNVNLNAGLNNSSIDLYSNGDVVISGNNDTYVVAINDIFISRGTEVADSGIYLYDSGDISLFSSSNNSTLDLYANGDVILSGNNSVHLQNRTSNTAGLQLYANGDVLLYGNNLSVDGTATFNNSVTIAGDLTVTGNVVSIEVTELKVEDSLIHLASNNFANSLDIGFVGHYSTDAGVTVKHNGIVWDASNSNFIAFDGLVQAGLDNGDTTINTGDGTFNLATIHAVISAPTATIGTLTLTSDLTVPNGGTGASSFTDNGIIYGNGTNALSVTAAGTEGQVLQAGAGGVPLFASLDGGTF
jgi:uncharacterized protein (DUF2345 family)